ncbi:MAG: hypothetical protein V1838_01470 [Patescibacteria group bacterium]
MSLKRYLISISVSTLLAWLSWVTVLFYVDPAAGWLAHILFHGSLFLAILGTFALLGFYLRVRLYPQVTLYRHVSISFRQGAWLALFSTGSLVLMGANLYVWWSALLFMFFLIIFELYFLSHGKKTNPRS